MNRTTSALISVLCYDVDKDILLQTVRVLLSSIRLLMVRPISLMGRVTAQGPWAGSNHYLLVRSGETGVIYVTSLPLFIELILFLKVGPNGSFMLIK